MPSETDEILDEIDMQGFSVIVPSVEETLYNITRKEGHARLLDVGVATRDAFSTVDENAREFARARAAELVGMRFDDEGELVENPDSEFAITDGTREYLRSTVESAIAEGLTPEELRDQLVDSAAFSPARAAKVARTEVARAAGQGGLQAAKEAGVSEKRWLLGEQSCEQCQENADAGWIALDEEFPSGDDCTPAHPNCTCDTIYRGSEEADSEEEKLLKEADFDESKHPRDDKGRFGSTGGSTANEQADTIHSYIAGFFSGNPRSSLPHLNEHIRSGKWPKEATQLVEALRPLPAYEGTTYRGTKSTSPPPEVGAILSNNGFWSTSRDEKVASPFASANGAEIDQGFRHEIVFEIQGSSGRNIQRFASTPRLSKQKEVLFIPRRQFEVLKREHVRTAVQGTVHRWRVTLKELD